VEARQQGLIGEKSELAAIDSTGLESNHRSTYFGSRCGQRKRRFPKVSIVIDVSSHLCLGAVVERGPKPDDPAFDRLVRASYRRQPFEVLLADAGYDGENHHRYLRDQFDVLGIIPPIRGRPPDDPHQQPKGMFRGLMAEYWDDLEEMVYGQRWQVETTFSMVKRNLGSALTARRRHALDREIHLRLLTHNLMIIRRPLHTFQHSMSGTFFALSGLVRGVERPSPATEPCGRNTWREWAPAAWSAPCQPARAEGDQEKVPDMLC